MYSRHREGGWEKTWMNAKQILRLTNHNPCPLLRGPQFLQPISSYNHRLLSLHNFLEYQPHATVEVDLRGLEQPQSLWESGYQSWLSCLWMIHLYHSCDSRSMPEVCYSQLPTLVPMSSQSPLVCAVSPVGYTVRKGFPYAGLRLSSPGFASLIPSP